MGKSQSYMVDKKTDTLSVILSVYNLHVYILIILL